MYLGIIGLFVIIAIIDSLTPKSKQDRIKSDEISAHVRAEEFIRAQLKSPRKAKFSSILWNADETRVMRLGKDKYKVNGWVEAQNSFGATLRVGWVCTVENVGDDSWDIAGFCGLLE